MLLTVIDPVTITHNSQHTHLGIVQPKESLKIHPQVWVATNHRLEWSDSKHIDILLDRKMKISSIVILATPFLHFLFSLDGDRAGNNLISTHWTKDL